MRLYERAAAAPGAETGQGPIWHVEDTRTFFAGPLRYNAGHQHGAPVYLAGLYSSFRLRVGAGAWTTCRTAMIPAGVVHELDLGGDPLGVLYVEPEEAGPDGLVPLMTGTRTEGGALIGSGGETALMRDLYEDRAAAGIAGLALADLLQFASARSRRDVDGRIARATALIHARAGECVPVAELAEAAGISASRFQRLFTQEVGVPYRRYRSWTRMRRAIRAVIEGANLTMAAHEAGFFDQAHLAHDFRKTFGAPASGSLVGIRR
ncbi:helix-turn-helix transcriptional regulator [Methylobacterium brachythecii]|uniref:AraC family transcriptional regulator n=1 Tax=Methylobacterium brachythecii TaxID=1176177 RepID=A0ABQ6D0P0_9HYPH|nr:AraC family transcriptional regulator [Methylobacterium brachythecii]GLS43888.1 AraC family transcriptional regulator [Methylobacterium brachythecii]